MMRILSQQWEIEAMDYGEIYQQVLSKNEYSFTEYMVKLSVVT